jgi:predicted transcriptional regulator of viral defense system
MKLVSLSDYVDRLQSHGRYSFTKDEAARAMKVTDVALTFALSRLSKKGRILPVKRGFYVIVPVE